MFKYHLEGEKRGVSEVFFDAPGIPDNITPSPNGGFYVGIVAVETEGRFLPSPLRLLRDYPSLRIGFGNFINNLINALEWIDSVFPSPLLASSRNLVGDTELGCQLAPPYALVVELDVAGNVIDSLHGTNGVLKAVCEGFAHGNWLFLGSPYASMDFIARVPRQ